MALEGLGMRGDKCSKGMLRTPAVMAVIAVMISLLPLLVACSSEGSEDQSAGSRQTGEGKQIGNAGDGTQSAHSSGSQAALVPIAHLNSTAENVSMEELSKTRGLAVGRGYRDDAAGLLGSSRFEGFDSGEAVIDHVAGLPMRSDSYPGTKSAPGSRPCRLMVRRSWMRNAAE